MQPWVLARRRTQKRGYGGSGGHGAGWPGGPSRLRCCARRTLVDTAGGEPSAHARPGRFEGYLVEDLGCRNEAIDRFRREPAFVDQVELVFANLLQAQVGRAGLIKSRQAGDVMLGRLFGFPNRDCEVAYFRSCVDEAVSCEGSLNVGLVIGE